MIRLVLAALCLLAGVAVFAIAALGFFRMRYVLNRFHVSAIGDTLGLGLIVLGLVLLSGLSWTSLKLLLIPAFVWLASPVATHMLAQAETLTNSDALAYQELTLEQVQQLENEPMANEPIANGQMEQGVADE